ncbi:hypothetical protein [Amycolatopsis sp. NBC_00438]|uniref:hypothetical protein n=1 Tax=Amycolatopsis sp. NBC_00438 TaxID=2903558 RepID=UPI002E213387
MAAPEHDPELFDELMRTERRRRPVGRYAIATLVFGLLVLAACVVWWRQPSGDRLPEGEAHGLDITAGQCFWSPTGTGEVDVLLTPRTERHTAEAFAVLPLAEGSMPDIGGSYQPILDRCQAAARPIPGARVQVMTPVSVSGIGGKPRAVCYYRFTAEMTAPAR